MPEPAPATASAPPDDAGLRIVLFGMPDAGKSSLLGGLAQSAQTQEHLLNGHLTDQTQGLAELQRRVYEDRPRETLEELVPYPIVFEPFTPNPAGKSRERVEAVLMDCDGRVANDLLARRRTLDPESDEGTLAAAILDADALLLVVDASASPVQTDADFAEFGRFLRTLEQSRGQRTEVGGQPVFLVLTKCDLLAQENDSAAAWQERIEERKRQVERRFHQFFEEENTDKPLPFGSIDLHVGATAVKQPALGGVPAKPREPYGIAELFRQVLDEARVFRGRRERSSRRVLWTVTGAMAVVAGMLGLSVALLASREPAQSAVLLNKVESYRAREAQTPSVRLREPLQAKIGELTDFTNDPEYALLPPREQEYVASRLQELQEYRQYKQKLQELRAPADSAGERDLEKIEAALLELAVPAARQKEWGQTEAALLRGQRLEDVKVIRAAVEEVDDWYRRITRRGEELLTFTDHKPKDGGPISWRDWHAQVQRLLDDAETAPHAVGDKLPGTSRVSYATPLRFDRITDDRRAWDVTKQRLLRLRDLSAALGLPGPVAGRPAVLEVRDAPELTPEQARARWLELEKAYPRHVQEFTLTDLPEAAVGEVIRAARASYENLRDTGRAVVLRRLKEVSTEGQETLEGWRRLLPWLANPEELQGWRALANLLLRLQPADASDPITALERFLRQDQLLLEIRHLTLEVPEDLKVRPVGKLSIYHGSGGETKPPLVFEPERDGRRDPRRRVTVYEFRATSGTSLTFKPGDVLWADLPLKDADNQEWLFTWSRNRSRLYEFERLARTARLHRKDHPNTAGKFADGVSLTTDPERGVPRVPDLIPIVPASFDKRKDS